MPIYTEFFWPVLSRIWSEYGDLLRVQSKCRKMRVAKLPNTDIFYVAQANKFDEQKFPTLLYADYFVFLDKRCFLLQ